MKPAKGQFLGPFRPLIWLFVISGVVLVIGLTLLFANDEIREMPLPVVLDPAEALDEKLDFSADDWYGAPGRNVSMENFTSYHTILVEIRRHGKEFSHPFTLNFRFDPESTFEFSTAGLEVARYDDLTRLWNRVSSRSGSVPGIVRSHSTTRPGYYALGRFKALEGGPTGSTNGSSTDDPVTKQPEEVGETSLLYRVQGAWRHEKDLKLVATLEEQALVVSVTGQIPSDLDLQYAAYFYVGQKDYDDDVPQQAKLLSDPSALEFVLPQGYRDAETVFFRLVSVEGETRLKGEVQLRQAR